MVQIPISNISKLFAAVAEKQAVYIPVDTDAGCAEYKKWEPGTELSSALNTVRSAKDFFFPQTESIVDFKMEGKNVEVVESRAETSDFTVFGVRACDAASFGILDKVFLAEPVDTFYKNRREHGTIITVACTEPAQTCFCSLFGIDATNPAGDVSGWIADGILYLEARTDKGTAFLSAFGSVCTETDSSGKSVVEKQKKEAAEKMKAQPFAGMNMNRFKPENLLDVFNDPAWAKLSEACLGCGTCTFVCPTCQCYDIRDFDTGHGIKRFRCWDSCMYSDFTKMAHGNPRLTQLERFRQRFMHKLVYFPSNNDGQFGCVGCGRCLAKCPISMNIVKVMKTLGDK